MYTYENKPECKAPKKKASSHSTKCIQKYAPSGLTPGFANKHMFRPLAANSLAYSDGTVIDDSTLVKLRGGRRDLMDLYEAATPGVAEPGNVDFEVPTVQYNGAAVTDTTRTANRYLNFTTDGAGRICHLENGAAAPPGQSYAVLNAALHGIRIARTAAMANAYAAINASAFAHISTLTVNNWIEKINREPMDPVTLDGHPDTSTSLNKILTEIADMNDFFTTFHNTIRENVNGRFFTPDIHKGLTKGATDTIASMIPRFIENLGLLKQEISCEEDYLDIYATELDYINSLIDDLNLYSQHLANLKQRIAGYGIIDLNNWIDNGITNDQLTYINAGINYSGMYI